MIIFSESATRKLLSDPDDGHTGILYHITSPDIKVGDIVHCQGTSMYGIVRAEHPQREDDSKDYRYSLQLCGSDKTCNYDDAKELGDCKLDFITLQNDDDTPQNYDACGNAEGNPSSFESSSLLISEEKIPGECKCQQCLSEGVCANIFSPIPYGSSVSVLVPAEGRSRGQQNLIDVAQTIIDEIEDECKIVVGIIDPTNDDIEYFNTLLSSYTDITLIRPTTSQDGTCSHLTGQMVTRIGIDYAETKCNPDGGKKCVASIIIDKMNLEANQDNINELVEEHDFNFKRAGCYDNGCSNTVIFITPDDYADKLESLEDSIDVIRIYNGNYPNIALKTPQDPKTKPKQNYEQRSECYKTYSDEYPSICTSQYQEGFNNYKYCIDQENEECIYKIEQYCKITNINNFEAQMSGVVNVLDEC